MFRKIVIAFAILLVINLLIFSLNSYYFGWEFSLVLGAVTAVIGLFAFIYYLLRWSQEVAEYVQSDLSEKPISFFAEKMLLLVGAVLLILPGILTDGLGLLLLMPVVREKLSRKALPESSSLEKNS